jgi:hypothetical protein
VIRTGGCLCGKVRYEVEGDPSMVGLCHCADCRKESGSSFVTYALWSLAAFSYSGELAVYRGRGFCPTCGSRLFNLQEETVEIRIGSLDEAPNGLMPMREGWVKRRELWLSPVHGASQAVEDP